MKKHVGDRMRELRLERGWRQEDLANKASITTQTISNLELGRYDPTFKTLHKLANAFEVKLVDLIRYELE